MKTNQPLIPLLLLFFLLATCPSLSQELTFNEVSPPEENPWGSIISITQDPQGFMWFGSTAGLFRYDGSQTKVYQHDPSDSNSLSGNIVLALFTDSHGMIWIGTLGSGLDRLDPVSNTFTHFRHQQGIAASLLNDSVGFIKEDHEGSLWIGTINGLDRYDRKTGTFHHYQHDERDSTSLSYRCAAVIYEDRQGTLWVGTSYPNSDNAGLLPGEGGLNKLDRRTGKFTRYLYDPKDPHNLTNNYVSTIFEDSRGTFWVGTGRNGLHTMNRRTSSFSRYPYDPAHPLKLSPPPVKKGDLIRSFISFITEDSTGAIWIGTNFGLTRYNANTGQITYYRKDRDLSGGLKDNNLTTAFSSRDGVL